MPRVNLRSFARNILVLIALFSQPAETLAAPPPQHWIDQLAAADPADRDAAEVALAAMGKSAVEPLKIAVKDVRGPVRQRAIRMLRRIRLFQVRGFDQALQYCAAYLNTENFDQRKSALNQIYQLKPQPNEVLTRLCVLESDEDLRKSMLYQLGLGYRDAIPRLIADDDDVPAVLSLLNDASMMWGGGAATDDAVALLLTNGLNDQIDICSAEFVNGDPTHREKAATRLCYLYRVCGNNDQAMKYARLAHEPSLIFLVLQDKGDWTAAANEPDDRWPDPLATAAIRSAFERLSGDFESAFNTINAVSNAAMADADRSMIPSKFFLLNDMPERGIELLTAQHPAAAFQMREARGEFAEAFSIAQKYRDHPTDAVELNGRLEALRRALGELPEPTVEKAKPAESADPVWDAAVAGLRDKKFLQAADAFSAMWAVNHTRADLLYLEGFALEQAGQSDRGKMMMKQAELIPLGNTDSRRKFALHLESAGLTDAAQSQFDFALRSNSAWDECGGIWIKRMNDAMAKQRWKQAAEAADRCCLISLSPVVEWTLPAVVLNFPAMAHLFKARLALERHDLPAAMREAQRYQVYLPASSEMIVQIVPALDAAGEHEKADHLFTSTCDQLAVVIRKYPKSVPNLNNLAWMSACCNRNLDNALAAAQTATQLRPDRWQQLDTLAEVHFRLGHRGEAVEIEKRAMAMTSDPYVARQVKRFESAAVPSTTQPVPEPR